MIVTNAKVYTQNDAMPKAEAFAVEDGKFVCVGSNEEVRQWAVDHEKTMEELDLGGKFIMPGIIDSHTHIAMSAFMGGDDDDDRLLAEESDDLRQFRQKRRPDAFQKM